MMLRVPVLTNKGARFDRPGGGDARNDNGRPEPGIRQQGGAGSRWRRLLSITTGFGRGPGVTMALVGLFVFRSAAGGQSIRGVVVEDQSGRPLQLAAVEVTDTTGATVGTDITSLSGRFALALPGPGVYVIEVAAMGYERLTVGPFRLDTEAEPEVRIPLVPSPIPIPGVTATVERARTRVFLENQGFYRRKRMGFGRFFSPEEIEAADPLRYADLLAGTPGVYFSYDGYLGEGLACGNFGAYGRSMIPQVFIDGVRVEFPHIRGAGSSVHLDTLVPITMVSAIEIYPRAGQAPAEFGATRASRSSSCIVLIWTK